MVSGMAGSELGLMKCPVSPCRSMRIFWLIICKHIYGCVLGQDIEKILLVSNGKQIFVGGNKALKAPLAMQGF